jgi:hypothetical protein
MRMEPMLKFVAMQNVERFRAKLNNEIHRDRRILLQRLLVEEEDRVGVTFELLASVQRAINDCRQQIAELRALLANNRGDTPDTAVAKARLEPLMASRILHDSYCRKLESKLYPDGR